MYTLPFKINDTHCSNPIVKTTTITAELLTHDIAKPAGESLFAIHHF